MKVCRNCTKEYYPSSNHINCPTCRNNLRKVLCECGNQIQWKSKKCIDCTAKQSFGCSNPNWKGGKTYHKKGYVLIRVKNHPRLKTVNMKYVFEHILVMENYLGRYLE